MFFKNRKNYKLSELQMTLAAALFTQQSNKMLQKGFGYPALITFEKTFFNFFKQTNVRNFFFHNFKKKRIKRKSLCYSKSASFLRCSSSEQSSSQTEAVLSLITKNQSKNFPLTQFLSLSKNREKDIGRVKILLKRTSHQFRLKTNLIFNSSTVNLKRNCFFKNNPNKITYRSNSLLSNRYQKFDSFFFSFNYPTKALKVPVCRKKIKDKPMFQSSKVFQSEIIRFSLDHKNTFGGLNNNHKFNGTLNKKLIFLNKEQNFFLLQNNKHSRQLIYYPFLKVNHRILFICLIKLQMNLALSCLATKAKQNNTLLQRGFGYPALKRYFIMKKQLLINNFKNLIFIKQKFFYNYHLEFLFFNKRLNLKSVKKIKISDYHMLLCKQSTRSFCLIFLYYEKRFCLNWNKIIWKIKKLYKKYSWSNLKKFNFYLSKKLKNLSVNNFRTSNLILPESDLIKTKSLSNLILKRASDEPRQRLRLTESDLIKTQSLSNRRRVSINRHEFWTKVQHKQSLGFSQNQLSPGRIFMNNQSLFKFVQAADSTSRKLNIQQIGNVDQMKNLFSNNSNHVHSKKHDQLSKSQKYNFYSVLSILKIKLLRKKQTMIFIFFYYIFYYGSLSNKAFLKNLKMKFIQKIIKSAINLNLNLDILKHMIVKKSLINLHSSVISNKKPSAKQPKQYPGYSRSNLSTSVEIKKRSKAKLGQKDKRQSNTLKSTEKLRELQVNLPAALFTKQSNILLQKGFALNVDKTKLSQENTILSELQVNLAAALFTQQSNILLQKGFGYPALTINKREFKSVNIPFFHIYYIQEINNFKHEITKKYKKREIELLNNIFYFKYQIIDLLSELQVNLAAALFTKQSNILLQNGFGYPALIKYLNKVQPFYKGKKQFKKWSLFNFLFFFQLFEKKLYSQNSTISKKAFASQQSVTQSIKDKKNILFFYKSNTVTTNIIIEMSDLKKIKLFLLQQYHFLNFYKSNLLLWEQSYKKQKRIFFLEQFFIREKKNLLSVLFEEKGYLFFYLKLQKLAKDKVFIRSDSVRIRLSELQVNLARGLALNKFKLSSGFFENFNKLPSNFSFHVTKIKKKLTNNKKNILWLQKKIHNTLKKSGNKSITELILQINETILSILKKTDTNIPEKIYNELSKTVFKYYIYYINLKMITNFYNKSNYDLNIFLPLSHLYLKSSTVLLQNEIFKNSSTRHLLQNMEKGKYGISYKSQYSITVNFEQRRPLKLNIGQINDNQYLADKYLCNLILKRASGEPRQRLRLTESDLIKTLSLSNQLKHYCVIPIKNKNIINDRAFCFFIMKIIKKQTKIQKQKQIFFEKSENKYLYHKFWKWAKRRHNNSSNRWIYHRYWKKKKIYSEDKLYKYYLLDYNYQRRKYNKTIQIDKIYT